VSGLGLASRVDIAFSSLIMIFIILVGTSYAMEAQIADTKFESIKIGSIKLSAMIVEPKALKTNVIVIMIPGILEPKIAFKSIALELAKLGVTSIALDLLGHASCNVPLEIELHEDYNKTMNSALSNLVKIYKDVFNYYKKRFSTFRFAILGIGLGASVAIILSAELQEFDATIAISPDVINDYIFSFLNEGTPKNFLVVLGSFESNKIPKAKVMMSYAGVKNIKPNKLYGDFYSGTARMLGITELSTGFLQYFHGGTLSFVRSWIRDTFDIDVKTVIPEDFRLYLLLTALFSSLALISLIPAVVSKRIGIFSGGKRWPTIESYKEGFKLSILWGLATLVYVPLVLPMFILFTRVIILPVFLTVIVSYDIVAILLAIYLISKIKGTSFKETFIETISELVTDVKNIYLGLIVAIIEFLTLFIVLADIAISPISLLYNPMLFIIAIVFFPLQLMMNLAYEKFIRRHVQEAFGGVTARAVVITVSVSFLARVLIILFFDLFLLFFAPNLGFVLLIFILLTFVQILIEAIAAITYVYTREITPAAIANSIWIVFVVALSPIIVTKFVSLGIIQF